MFCQVKNKISITLVQLTVRIV